MESLATGGAKKRGKPPPRIAHLEESISRHKTHVGRLEAIMRLLDNGGPLSCLSNADVCASELVGSLLHL